MSELAIKTSPALLEVLRRSATIAPKKDDLEKQRVSFVYSFMSPGKDITRADVKRLVESEQGAK